MNSRMPAIPRWPSLPTAYFLENGRSRTMVAAMKRLVRTMFRKLRTMSSSVCGPQISSTNRARNTNAEPPYFRPAEDSPEYKYLMQRRRALDGPLPQRSVEIRRPLEMPDDSVYGEFDAGSGKADTRFVSWVGDLVVQQPSVPFREPPESALQ